MTWLGEGGDVKVESVAHTNTLFSDHYRPILSKFASLRIEEKTLSLTTRSPYAHPPTHPGPEQHPPSPQSIRRREARAPGTFSQVAEAELPAYVAPDLTRPQGARRGRSPLTGAPCSMPPSPRRPKPVFLGGHEGIRCLPRRGFAAGCAGGAWRPSQGVLQKPAPKAAHPSPSTVGSPDLRHVHNDRPVRLQSATRS